MKQKRRADKEVRVRRKMARGELGIKERYYPSRPSRWCIVSEHEHPSQLNWIRNENGQKAASVLFYSFAAGDLNQKVMLS